jgi:hypothetical protein
MSFHGSITNIERLPESNERIARIIERPDALDEGAEWVVEIRAMGTHWNSRSRLAEFDRDALRFAYQSMSDDANPFSTTWSAPCSPRLRSGQRHYFKMLTARAMTSATVITEMRACVSIVNFAHRVMGITSVGLNAIAFVDDTYR